ncbi:MAG: tetratricopeptide repeat protein [Chitinophagaceae bacterium]
MRWLIAVILLAGCTGKQDKGVLEKAPFATITDSIKKFPDDAGLLVRRAELLSQHNLHELANQDYAKAWQRDSSENLLMSYVSNLFLVNKPREAVRLLQSGVKRFPENADFRRRLSEAYLQSGRNQDALAQYDSILQQDSTNFEAWYEKGLMLLEGNDTAAAINALARSYALQPLSMNGLALANLYAETKNPLALTIADDLLSKDDQPENIDPIFIKGIYYSNTGQHQQAREQFDKIIRIDYKFADAYIEKGIILFEEKNIDEALETFKMAATVATTNPDAYYWQGRCYESVGKTEEAMDNYIRAYALDRQFVEAKRGIDRLRKK